MADTPSPPSPEILEKLRQLREELAQKAAQQAPKDANTLAWQQSNAFKRIYPRAEGGQVDMDRMRLELMNGGGKAKFLKDSKVKERVYHGTGNLEGLTSFDPAMTGKGTDQLGSGFYFTTHPDEASGYAGNYHPNREEKNSSPGVVAAHLAIKKPIKIGPNGASLNDARINLSHEQVKQIIGRAPKILDPDESPLNNHVDTSRGVTPKMIHDIARLYTGNNLHALENDIFPGHPTEYRHALHKVTGHDGVVKDFGDGRKHYVAWFPEQVKSAIGNRGTYDINDPDITKKRGGRVTHAHQLDIEERPL